MKVKVIDEKEVKVLKRKLRKRIALKVKLLSVLGSSFEEIADAVSFIKDGDGESDMMSVVLPIIGKIFSTLDEEAVQKLIDALLVGVYVGDVDVSDEDKFEAVFGESEVLLYKVLAYSLEVNMGDFLSQIGISFGRLEKDPTQEK